MSEEDTNILDDLVQKMPPLVLNPEPDNKRQFQRFSELKEFIQREMNTWNSYGGQFIRQVREAFQTFSSDLTNVEQQAKTNPSQVENTLRNLIGRSNGGSRETHIYSDTGLGKFLLALPDQAADGAYACHRNTLDHSHMARGPFLRGVLSYILFFEGLTGKLRSEGESAALEKLRGQLNALHDQRRGDLEKLVAEWETFREASETEHRDQLRNHGGHFEELSNKYEDAFNEQVSGQEVRFTDSQREWNERVKQLETTYEEKLTLDAPVRHWNALQHHYRKWGRIWLATTLALSVAFIYMLLKVAYLPPEFLEAPASDFSLLQVRGLVLFGLAVSVAIYFIRLCSKLTMSAFHLSRDARERSQLTRVYLALLKGKTVEERDREIVLQALFSRADTGLLKADSQPTMPSPVSAIRSNLQD